ncbi:MAG TPA: type II secretion system F family protein [Kiloniellales bacterium]|nr:type II secretion system F family protein [Kiloniellales bacterium]
MSSELTSFVLPLAAAFFLSFLALGTAYLLWWDRAIRRRGLRFERVIGTPYSQTERPAFERELAFRSEQQQSRWKRMERRLSRYLPNRSALQRRLDRAGFRMGVGTLLVAAVIVGTLIGFSVHTLSGLALYLCALIGLAGGFFIVNVFIGFAGRRRSEKFLRQLPEAIDIIIRSVRAGLPIMEGISVVKDEFPAPLGEEFATVRDRVQFGATLEEALWLIAQRIERAEFNFLVIAVAVQRETGGNLTEALANLSQILRQREQMKLKVRALSSEARASAYILGALPFVMGILIYFLNPGYIDQLFLDPRGHAMLGFGLGTITAGAVVMYKMIKFEI